MGSTYILFLAAAAFTLFKGCRCSEAEHRLFATLFANYSQFIRPVENVSDPAIIQFEVSMSQLVKVDEVNQIMETNLWLKHERKGKTTASELAGRQYAALMQR